MVSTLAVLKYSYVYSVRLPESSDPVLKTWIFYEDGSYFIELENLSAKKTFSGRLYAGRRQRLLNTVYEIYSCYQDENSEGNSNLIMADDSDLWTLFIPGRTDRQRDLKLSWEQSETPERITPLIHIARSLFSYSGLSAAVNSHVR